MKRLLTILAGCCFTAVPAPSQEVRISVNSGEKSPGRTYPRWTVFAHPRFAYELPVPPGVRAIGPPDAGTDATFVSIDGAFKMTAWGGLSPHPAATVLAREWENARERPGHTFFFAR